MKIKDFNQSGFMLICIATSLIFLYPVLVFPKGVLELLINRYHYPSLDIFFKYITHLGDGSLLAVLLIGLLFYNYYSAILTAFAIIVQAVLVSLFKRWIFSGLERPIAFFEDGTLLNFVDGVDVHSSNTFPSGHTATAFALFALIYTAIKNRGSIIALILILLAFSVGFSRIYLLQHFVVDVYFGALIGVFSVIAGLVMIEVFFKDEKQKMLMTKSLRDLKNKMDKQ